MNEKLIFHTDEDVIRNYADMVYKLAYSKTGTRHDADDVFQNVFMRYVRRRPVFQDETHRKAWLLRVTINCCNHFFTTAFRRNTTELKDELVATDREFQDLHQELQKIPKKYREVIHLFYYEEMSLEEISVLLNRKNSTVRTQLTRARNLLKSFMNEEDYYV